MVQVKAEEFVQSTKETASAATDKANAAANTTGQTAQQNKDESAGFLQQVANFSIRYHNFGDNFFVIELLLNEK